MTRLPLWRELGAGYGYFVVVAVVVLLVLPWQAARLGDAGWATVAFCLSVQALLMAADLALSPLLLRDAAAADSARLAALLADWRRRHARAASLMAGIAIVVGLALWATDALGSLAAVSPQAAVAVLVAFAFQLRNAGTLAAWHARGGQVSVAARQSSFLVMRHALASLALIAGYTSASVYLGCFAVVAALEWWMNRRGLSAWIARRATVADAAGRPVTVAAGPPELRAAMASALLALVSSQIDRLWLGWQLPAVAFAPYALLCLPLASYLSLQMPIQRSLLPRLARSGESGRLLRTFVLLHAGLALPCIGLALAAEPLLALWLRDPAQASASAPVLAALAFALALQVATSPAAALLILQRRWRILLSLQGAALAVQVALLWTLAPLHGAWAGVAAWYVPGAIGLVTMLAVVVPRLRGPG
jgi:O-antigen/teichoic acid export membrane protein